MANWAHVENNKIQGRYDLLPKSWRNISGLDLSQDDLPFLKSLGWYPVTKDNTTFDETKYYINDYKYSIRTDDVLETPILTEKEVKSFELLKDDFFQVLRAERNKKLMESDWTQLTDVQNTFNQETKDKWLLYRQQLRDITILYSDNSVVDFSQVSWPSISN